MSFRNGVKELDRGLGAPVTKLVRNGRAVRGALSELVQTRSNSLRFRRELRKRVRRYKDSGFVVEPHSSIVEKLNKDGFAVLRQVFDQEVLIRIKDELERHLDAGSCLTRISKDSARVSGDRSAPSTYLDESEVARGQSYFRQHTNYVSVENPMINCPSTVAAAFDERLIDIAAGYLSCIPSIGGINLRKSFVNELPEFDTLYFHSDENSPKFLKFFFYLNEVDEDGGPFCYVRGSNREKFRGWTSKYRWSFDEIAARYGEDRIVNLTGELGDLIIADTTGFHRGTKVRSRDRSMLTVDYVVHPEYWNEDAGFDIASESYARLSAKQKAAADFLRVAK